MTSPHFDAGATAARRARLSTLLGDMPALVPAGSASPKNFPANVYPFRASSHFLYLVGAALPEAFALVDGEGCTVFVRPPSEDDALWHGATPSLEELAETLGCRVAPLDELPSALSGRAVASVPAADLATRLEQARLLGRAPSAETPTAEDDTLLDAIVALRLVHDDAAVAGLRRAAEATTAAHTAGMRATRAGVSEAAICAAMEAALATRNMTTAYGSIVTVHGEVLHNDHHGNECAAGDLLLADVGAETEGGWAGDVTRTWPVNGTFSPTQRDFYDVVLQAELEAIAAVKPGARYRDVHLTASRVLARGLVDLGVLRGDPEELVADGVHALLFPHGVGHLLGLDVHDMEDLGDRAGYAPGRERSDQFGLGYLRLDRDLEPGMAVTIEPGLYLVPAILEDAKLAAIAGDRLDRDVLAKFSDVRGIRIEDDVLVTEHGHEVLTAEIPKAAADVESAVGAS